MTLEIGINLAGILKLFIWLWFLARLFSPISKIAIKP